MLPNHFDLHQYHSYGPRAVWRFESIIDKTIVLNDRTSYRLFSIYFRNRILLLFFRSYFIHFDKWMKSIVFWGENVNPSFWWCCAFLIFLASFLLCGISISEINDGIECRIHFLIRICINGFWEKFYSFGNRLWISDKLLHRNFLYEIIIHLAKLYNVYGTPWNN